MNRNGRLPKTIRSQFAKRRLDFFTEKNELIKDITELGGAAELDMLHENIASFGEPLEPTLRTLSLPRLRRVHARVVLGELTIPVEDDF